MKSPFATALTVARRALDAVRADIGEQSERLSCLEARQVSLRALLATERQVASADPELPRGGYFERAAAERVSLEQQAASVREVLAQLRAEALERFAAAKALELADARWQTERARERERREQAVADDRAAFAFRQALDRAPC